MNTLTPTNLNHENDNLVAEFASLQTKEIILDRTLVTSVATQYSTVRETCRLSEEQLAASGATVKRIGIEEKIDDYMFTLHSFYPGVTKDKTIPDYLKKSGKDEEYIPRFFTNIDVIPVSVISLVMQVDGITIDTAKGWQAEWEIVKKEETLDAQAKQLVRAALDFRIKLIGDLRYLGYSTSEI
jgi:hypothetical protein